MLKQLGIAIALLTLFTIGALAQNDAGHAIIGELKKVDRATGKVVVKTAEGTEETFKFTGKTLGTASKRVAKGSKKEHPSSFITLAREQRKPPSAWSASARIRPK